MNDRASIWHAEAWDRPYTARLAEYRRRRTEWILSNRGSTIAEFQFAMRELAKRLGV